MANKPITQCGRLAKRCAAGRVAALAGCAAAALAVSGCADPYGRTDPLRTGLLGAGLGGGVGLLGGALAQDQQFRRQQFGYGGRGYGYGYPPSYLPPVAAPFGGAYPPRAAAPFGSYGYGSPYGFGGHPGVRW